MARAPRSKSGIEVTDETAERLADEAEARYDLTESRRVGRKSLAGGSGRSPRINVRITPELYERAKQRATAEGTTISDLARKAFEAYIGKGARR
jgi:predicted DNA-binding protein